jgi:chromosome transmission fidelity protein 1
MRQVVAVPYNILLHAGTREASGLSLAGNVVVLDEAHNIIDTITALHSVTLTGQTVCSIPRPLPC